MHSTMVLCIVQWYYVLQHYNVASRSTAYSTVAATCSAAHSMLGTFNSSTVAL